MGDGSQINHAYNFPGEYNVVLNGTFGSGEAVARTKVKIIKPLITIKSADGNEGYIELANQDVSEVNLNDWQLGTKTGSFKIPLDTIISGRSALKIPLAATKLNLTDQNTISLFYPDGRPAAAYTYIAQAVSEENDVVRQQKLQEIGARLKQLSSQVSLLAAQASAENQNTPIELADSNQLTDKTNEEGASPNPPITSSAATQAAGVIVLNKLTQKGNQGLLGQTWQWVSRLWR